MKNRRSELTTDHSSLPWESMVEFCNDDISMWKENEFDKKMPRLFSTIEDRLKGYKKRQRKWMKEDRLVCICPLCLKRGVVPSGRVRRRVSGNAKGQSRASLGTSRQKP